MVEREVLTTFSFEYLVRISQENGRQDDLERIRKSNRMRAELSRRFRLGILFESVQRGSVTTILCEYSIRIGRAEGCYYSCMSDSSSYRSREELWRRVCWGRS